MFISTGTRLGRYEIRSPLGAGGMGEVYLAWDTQLDRTVALKVLPADVAGDQQRMRRFLQEAKAVSAVNHPNILTIFEIGQAGSVQFIATEFIDGVTLRQRMASTGMPLSEVLDIAIQVADALAAAHAAGTVHRDIKPENIMLRCDSFVKILDFGLAKLTEQQAIHSEATTLVKTIPGVVLGTTTYMSPEQARGLEVDARSDIWSLGVVLYEMITGQAPFTGATASDVIASILERKPPALTTYRPEIPEALEWVTMKALRKDREERSQTAKDLAVDLRQLRQKSENEAELKQQAQQELHGGKVTANRGGQAAVEVNKESTQNSSQSNRTALPARKRPSRTAINSLAILPLVNQSADPDAEYLSDGITESIINSLSQIPKLRVMARSTVFRYKGREVDPQTVGRELGVRAVLTGRVLQPGDRLIIGVELVDVTDGSQLWGEQYNRGSSDILAVQEEISREISEKLRVRLTGKEKKRLTKRHTESTEAYHAFLKGRYFKDKWTQEGVKKGIEYFEQAIEIDPIYALAYVGLADSYIALCALNVIPSKEGYPKARAAVTKALEIDDTLAEAHISLAKIKEAFDWDWPGAEREFKHAIELNPNYPTAHLRYGRYLLWMGRFDEGMAEIKRAYELDPLSPIINTNLSLPLVFTRQYDRCIESLQKTVQMHPNFLPVHSSLGMAYRRKGMYEEAITELQKAMELSGSNTDIYCALGYVYAVSDRKEKAQDILNQVEELSKLSYVSPSSIAMIYTGLRDKDQAFAWLQKAYEERDVEMECLKVAPVWDSLRSDPRFADLLWRIGLAA